MKVSCQVIPWGEAHAKLITAFVGGHHAGRGATGHHLDPRVPRHGRPGSPGPLHCNGTASTARSFFPGAWKTVLFDDGCYGVPWYVETRCLFYRKDILAAAGLAGPPRTWEELESSGRALAAEDGPIRHPPPRT